MTKRNILCYNQFVIQKGQRGWQHGGIPKLAEGTGLENQQVVQAALGFKSLFLRHLI